MTEEDIDDLREQTRGSDRIGSDSGGAGGDEDRSGDGSDGSASADVEPAPTPVEVDVAPSEGFDDAVSREIDRARTGIAPRSYSGDDPRLGGLFETLRERPDDAERLAEALAAAANEAPPETVDKATLVDLAVEAGLEAAAPDVSETLEQYRR